MHRIGRTARAGAEGIAISFCDNEEVSFLRDIEKLIQTRLPATERRSAPRSDAAPHHRPQNANGRNGNRRNGQPQRRNGGGNGHNGKPQHRNANGHQAQQPRRNEHGQQGQQRRQENRHAPAASAPDNIATVGFMRQPEPRRSPGDASRHTR